MTIGNLVGLCGELWKTLWKSEILTGTKVYAKSIRPEISMCHKLRYSIKSMTYETCDFSDEISRRFRTSVHNWAFPVKNSTAAQQKLDALLEEMT